MVSSYEEILEQYEKKYGKPVTPSQTVTEDISTVGLFGQAIKESSIPSLKQAGASALEYLSGLSGASESEDLYERVRKNAQEEIGGQEQYLRERFDVPQDTSFKSAAITAGQSLTPSLAVMATSLLPGGASLAASAMGTFLLEASDANATAKDKGMDDHLVRSSIAGAVNTLLESPDILLGHAFGEMIRGTAKTGRVGLAAATETAEQMAKKTIAQKLAASFSENIPALSAEMTKGIKNKFVRNVASGALNVELPTLASVAVEAPQEYLQETVTNIATKEKNDGPILAAKSSLFTSLPFGALFGGANNLSKYSTARVAQELQQAGYTAGQIEKLQERIAKNQESQKPEASSPVELSPEHQPDELMFSDTNGINDPDSGKIKVVESEGTSFKIPPADVQSSQEDAKASLQAFASILEERVNGKNDDADLTTDILEFESTVTDYITRQAQAGDETFRALYEVVNSQAEGDVKPGTITKILTGHDFSSRIGQPQKTETDPIVQSLVENLSTSTETMTETISKTDIENSLPDVIEAVKNDPTASKEEKAQVEEAVNKIKQKVENKKKTKTPRKKKVEEVITELGGSAGIEEVIKESGGDPQAALASAVLSDTEEELTTIERIAEYSGTKPIADAIKEAPQKKKAKKEARPKEVAKPEPKKSNKKSIKTQAPEVAEVETTPVDQPDKIQESAPIELKDDDYSDSEAMVTLGALLEYAKDLEGVNLAPEGSERKVSVTQWLLSSFFGKADAKNRMINNLNEMMTYGSPEISDSPKKSRFLKALVHISELFGTKLYFVYDVKPSAKAFIVKPKLGKVDVPAYKTSITIDRPTIFLPVKLSEIENKKNGRQATRQLVVMLSHELAHALEVYAPREYMYLLKRVKVEKLGKNFEKLDRVEALTTDIGRWLFKLLDEPAGIEKGQFVDPMKTLSAYGISVDPTLANLLTDTIGSMFASVELPDILKESLITMFKRIHQNEYKEIASLGTESIQKLGADTMTGYGTQNYLGYVDGKENDSVVEDMEKSGRSLVNMLVYSGHGTGSKMNILLAERDFDAFMKGAEKSDPYAEIMEGIFIRRNLGTSLSGEIEESLPTGGKSPSSIKTSTSGKLKGTMTINLSKGCGRAYALASMMWDQAKKLPGDRATNFKGLMMAIGACHADNPYCTENTAMYDSYLNSISKALSEKKFDPDAVTLMDMLYQELKPIIRILHPEISSEKFTKEDAKKVGKNEGPLKSAIREAMKLSGPFLNNSLNDLNEKFQKNIPALGERFQEFKHRIMKAISISQAGINGKYAYTQVTEPNMRPMMMTKARAKQIARSKKMEDKLRAIMTGKDNDFRIRLNSSGDASWDIYSGTFEAFFDEVWLKVLEIKAGITGEAKQMPVFIPITTGWYAPFDMDLHKRLAKKPWASMIKFNMTSPLDFQGMEVDLRLRAIELFSEAGWNIAIRHITDQFNAMGALGHSAESFAKVWRWYLKNWKSLKEKGVSMPEAKSSIYGSSQALETPWHCDLATVQGKVKNQVGIPLAAVKSPFNLKYRTALIQFFEREGGAEVAKNMIDHFSKEQRLAIMYDGILSQAEDNALDPDTASKIADRIIGEMARGMISQAQVYYGSPAEMYADIAEDLPIKKGEEEERLSDVQFLRDLSRKQLVELLPTDALYSKNPEKAKKDQETYDKYVKLVKKYAKMAGLSEYIQPSHYGHPHVGLKKTRFEELLRLAGLSEQEIGEIYENGKFFGFFETFPSPSITWEPVAEIPTSDGGSVVVKDSEPTKGRYKITIDENVFGVVCCQTGFCQSCKSGCTALKDKLQRLARGESLPPDATGLAEVGMRETEESLKSQFNPGEYENLLENFHMIPSAFKMLLGDAYKNVVDTPNGWVIELQDGTSVTIDMVKNKMTFNGKNAVGLYSFEGSSRMIQIYSGMSRFQVEMTAFHEAYHFLKRLALNGNDLESFEKYLGGEEQAAELFANFVLTGRVGSEQERTIFQKIWDFIKQIGRALLGKKADENHIEKVMKILASGKFVKSVTKDGVTKFYLSDDIEEVCRKLGTAEKIEEKSSVLPRIARDIKVSAAVKTAPGLVEFVQDNNLGELDADSVIPADVLKNMHKDAQRYADKEISTLWEKLKAKFGEPISLIEKIPQLRDIRNAFVSGGEVNRLISTNLNRMLYSKNMLSKEELVDVNKALLIADKHALSFRSAIMTDLRSLSKGLTVTPSQLEAITNMYMDQVEAWICGEDIDFMEAMPFADMDPELVGLQTLTDVLSGVDRVQLDDAQTAAYASVRSTLNAARTISLATRHWKKYASLYQAMQKIYGTLPEDLETPDQMLERVIKDPLGKFPSDWILMPSVTDLVGAVQSVGASVKEFHDGVASSVADSVGKLLAYADSITDPNNKSSLESLYRIVTTSEELENAPAHAVSKFIQAFMNEKDPARKSSLLKQAYAKEMQSFGKRSMYAPHMRRTGDFALIAIDTTSKNAAPYGQGLPSGTVVYRTHGTRKEMERAGSALRNQMKGERYHIAVVPSNNLPQDAHLDFDKAFALDSLQRAIERAEQNADTGSIATDIVTYLAEWSKTKGFLSSTIQRSDSYILGFEDDITSQVERYISGISGMVGKSVMAQDFAGFLAQIDRKMSPSSYSYAASTMKDLLRNSESGDRIEQKLKRLNFFIFLAGRISTGLVNLTAIPTNGIPRMMLKGGGETGLVDGLSFTECLGYLKDASTLAFKFNKAIKDAHKEMVFDVEKIIEIYELEDYKDIFTQFYQNFVRGDLAPSVASGLIGSDPKLGDSVMQKVTNCSSFFLRKSEEFMRHAVYLASIQAGLKRGHKDIGELAKQASLMQMEAFGDMSKFNIPLAFRGGSGLAGLSRATVYAYQNWAIHNFSNFLRFLKASVSEGQFKPLVGQISAYLFLGGFGAFPGVLAALFAVMKAVGYDPEKEWINDGKASTMLRLFQGGVPHALGVTDISRRVGFAPYESVIPQDRSFLQSAGRLATGPVGGIGENFFKAGQALSKGQYGKAVQTVAPLIVKDVINTVAPQYQDMTLSGRRNVSPSGEPYSYSAGERILSVLGLPSSASSERRSVLGAYRKQKEDLRDELEALVRDYAEKKSQGKNVFSIYKRMKDYNEKAMDFNERVGAEDAKVVKSFSDLTAMVRGRERKVKTFRSQDEIDD